MKRLTFVGASLLAKNNDAVCLPNRSAYFASRLAPTGFCVEGLHRG
jgi:hypothetical protein